MKLRDEWNVMTDVIFSDEGDTCCGGVLYEAAPRGHIVKFRFLPGGGIYGIAWEKKVSSPLAYAHSQVSVLRVRLQYREILVLTLHSGWHSQTKKKKKKERQRANNNTPLFLCSAMRTCTCNRQHKATTRVEVMFAQGRKIAVCLYVSVTERDRKMS